MSKTGDSTALEDEPVTAFKKLIPTSVWMITSSCGDGSIRHRFFLSNRVAKKCERDDEGTESGFSEPTLQEIETFVGSKTYREATEDENDYLCKGKSA